MHSQDDTAPFHEELAEAPDGGSAVWIKTSDGVRLRAGLWPRKDARGTILMFPGRTEYVEKYGRVAVEFCKAGFAFAAIDWRGQGASDRLHDDPLLGHVDEFPDYQKDVAAFVDAVKSHGLPEPFFLIAHSMGGAIGLRAMIEGLSIERAVFSAPMWGIYVSMRLKPVAAIVPPLARRLGKQLNYTPGTRPTAYVTETDFKDNLLTTDREHFEYLGRQAAADTRFALGGPSLHWFSEAVREGKTLAALPRPAIPTQVYVGSLEQIVSTKAIERIVANWPHATLEFIPGAKHELMMEAPPFRSAFMDGTRAFFERAL